MAEEDDLSWDPRYSIQDKSRFCIGKHHLTLIQTNDVELLFMCTECLEYKCIVKRYAWNVMINEGRMAVTADNPAIKAFDKWRETTKPLKHDIQFDSSDVHGIMMHCWTCGFDRNWDFAKFEDFEKAMKDHEQYIKR